ncbi:hypothetical protein [Acidisphaera rubrifaciens]|uniref:Lipoprotein n=1 Tax=Acidisphaera rubrifaciens HS-AP3 TaxID=1231350 RepID=A0A0D6P559_9PROT|nr:hypothetical protein [Acidisphaera rubrifaciens]GAN76476.1 hypothetical protein Asru_0102_11 [Acidisphaera rubrifaciens HS-AP3]
MRRDGRVGAVATGAGRLACALALAGAVSALAACSSSSGGGSSRPASPTYIIMPNGQTSTCLDGSAPPCK